MTVTLSVVGLVIEMRLKLFGFLAQILSSMARRSGSLSSMCAASRCAAAALHFARLHFPYDDGLKELYRKNFHSRPTKKWVPAFPNRARSGDNDDAMYVVKSSQTNELLAALRLSRSKHDAGYSFLRSLCVHRDHRRRNLASLLLQEALEDFGAQHTYCFATPELNRLYELNGFTEANTEESSAIMPKWLLREYGHQVDRSKPDPMSLFVRIAKSRHLPRIVLLQHIKEAQSRTGTASGWLLDDRAYKKNNPDDERSLNLVFSRWIWTGRDDANKTKERIERLQNDNRDVYLLWKGAGVVKSKLGSPPQSTFIIIDGTWQEANAIYRKTPALWQLPRFDVDAPPSEYSMRSDFGWKDKFAGVDSNLLCTAEAGAAVMDICGDTGSAELIRERLGRLQSVIDL